MTSQPRSRRIATLLAFLAVLAATAPGAALNEGVRAPEIGLSTHAGQSIQIASLRGKVVIVDFFASWCPPCREELPVLERLYGRYRERGLVIVGVSVDDEESALTRFLSRMPLSFPVVRDHADEVARRYRPTVMPSSYFVDRNGIVRYVHRSFRARDADAIEQKIRELLGA